MRRLALILILVISVSYACKSQHTIRQIDFTKSSRGFREELILTKDSVFIMIDNARSSDSLKRVSEKLDKTKWAKLNTILNSLSLPEVPLLKSPTMKRAYDGALHGILTITDMDGKTYSHGFDDENPHPKLQQLMKCILEIRDKIIP
jgi:hypothetical protein